MWTPSSSSMMRQACTPIFASLHGYPGKWARTLDEGKDISVWDLLMHMEKTFSNKHDYDAMIRTLYEVQQKEDETVEEYMLRIHDVVAVICCCTRSASLIGAGI